MLTQAKANGSPTRGLTNRLVDPKTPQPTLFTTLKQEVTSLLQENSQLKKKLKSSASSLYHMNNPQEGSESDHKSVAAALSASAELEVLEEKLADAMGMSHAYEAEIRSLVEGKVYYTLYIYMTVTLDTYTYITCYFTSTELYTSVFLK